MDFPILEMSVNEGDSLGIKCVSLVKNPAIQVGWIAFSEQEITFAIESEEEKIVFGPALIPNQKIPRKSIGEGDFYVTASEQSIKNIRDKFFKEKNTDIVNTEHEGDKRSAYLVESFISSSRIPSPAPFDKLPQGTLFMSYKIEDDNLWNDVKSGKFLGFSIEGNFELNHTSQEEKVISEIRKMIESKLNKRK